MKIKNKKSQVTSELLIVSGILFIIFLFTIVIINNRNDHIISFRKYMTAKDIAEKTSYMINNVYISGFGSRDFVYIPSKIDKNTNFNLTIIPKHDNHEFISIIMQLQIPYILCVYLHNYVGEIIHLLLCRYIVIIDLTIIQKHE